MFLECSMRAEDGEVVGLPSVAPSSLPSELPQTKCALQLTPPRPGGLGEQTPIQSTVSVSTPGWDAEAQAHHRCQQ